MVPHHYTMRKITDRYEHDMQALAAQEHAADIAIRTRPSRPPRQRFALIASAVRGVIPGLRRLLRSRAGAGSRRLPGVALGLAPIETESE